MATLPQRREIAPCVGGAFPPHVDVPVQVVSLLLEAEVRVLDVAAAGDHVLSVDHHQLVVHPPRPPEGFEQAEAVVELDLHALVHQVSDDRPRDLVPLGVDDQPDLHSAPRGLTQQVEAGQPAVVVVVDEVGGVDRGCRVPHEIDPGLGRIAVGFQDPDLFGPGRRGGEQSDEHADACDDQSIASFRRIHP